MCVCLCVCVCTCVCVCVCSYPQNCLDINRLLYLLRRAYGGLFRNISIAKPEKKSTMFRPSQKRLSASADFNLLSESDTRLVYSVALPVQPPLQFSPRCPCWWSSLIWRPDEQYSWKPRLLISPPSTNVVIQNLVQEIGFLFSSCPWTNVCNPNPAAWFDAF